MRLKAAIAVGGAAALVLGIAACGRNEGPPAGVDTGRKATGVIATDPEDSLGPAPEVPGATRGGTVTIIRGTPISHLDPQRVYSFAGLSAAPLYSRFLTTFKDDGKGHVVLVGDLAETPGTNVNGDCKVWEFKIKDGVRFEDGSPITSKEIAYGIARSFDPELSGGPTYIQEWLADSGDYASKFDFAADKSALPPGLSTPDARTVRFEFARPHCDLPFAAALPATAPLKPDRDKGVDLDNRPFSSGPYKITENTVGVKLVLERNDQWDPRTDPVRHQYPDTFVWQWGPDQDTGVNRVIADSGPDRTALAWDGIPAALVPRVTSDRSLTSRTLLEPTPSANRLTINTQRVTDLSVRRALNYAIDRKGLIQTIGGRTLASPMTTLMPPTTIGFKQYDAYPAGSSGNPRKAKELLAGRTPRLVLAVRDSAGSQRIGAQLKSNLERAGFKIILRATPADSMLDETKRKDNPWDLYLDSWAADWPSGAAILPVLFDGRTIKAEGNSDTSYINDDALNAAFDRVLAMEPAEQAKEWGELDERIMRDLAPAVPLFVDVAHYLHGSKLGGVFVGSIFGYPMFTDAYVKR